MLFSPCDKMFLQNKYLCLKITRLQLHKSSMHTKLIKIEKVKLTSARYFQSMTDPRQKVKRTPMLPISWTKQPRKDKK